MTVNELSTKCGFKGVAIPDGEKQVTGGYAGDLLSWVMGRAKEGDAWITIMSNVNIIAVAALADVACIILTEGVGVDEDIIKTAVEKGVNVLSTDLTTYETAVLISQNI